jgi:hypothetical protein
MESAQNFTNILKEPSATTFSSSSVLKMASGTFCQAVPCHITENCNLHFQSHNDIKLLVVFLSMNSSQEEA